MEHKEFPSSHQINSIHKSHNWCCTESGGRSIKSNGIITILNSIQSTELAHACSLIKMSAVTLKLNVTARSWGCFGHKVSLKTEVGPCISVTNVKRDNDFPCGDKNLTSPVELLKRGISNPINPCVSDGHQHCRSPE